MPHPKLFRVVAVVGLGAVSLAAWWFQKTPSVSSPKEVSGLASAGAPAQAGAATPAASGAVRATGVEVTKIERASLQDDAQAVGSLRSKQAVVVRPEVAGRIVELGFTDGGRVRKGQLLAQLDDVLQRAEVKQSQAQVGIAKANFTRNQELVAQNFVAQRVLDESAAGVSVAEAQLSLSCARLVRMRVEAPFDGTVGIRTVNVGDYVKDGADVINLEDISAMFVDFRLPERFQTKVRQGQSVDVQLDAFPGRVFKAKVQAIDPTIDANGRSVAVRAVLPNTGGDPLVARGGAGAGPGGGAGAANAGKSATAGTGPRGGGGAAKPQGGSSGRAKPGAGAGPGAANAQAGAPAERGNAVSEEFKQCQVHVKRGAPVAGNPGAGLAGGGPLRPGMFARVTTVFAVKDNALVVPEEAIVPQGGRQFIIRVVDRSAVPGTATAALPPEFKEVSQRVEVRLGVRRAGKVEVDGVTQPLAEGDAIVIAGQQRLQRDGTAVRVVELGRPNSGASPAVAASATLGAK